MAVVCIQCKPKYVSILYRWWFIQRPVLALTLKSGLEVTQGHWEWCNSKALVYASHSNYGCIYLAVSSQYTNVTGRYCITAKAALEHSDALKKLWRTLRWRQQNHSSLEQGRGLLESLRCVHTSIAALQCATREPVNRCTWWNRSHNASLPAPLSTAYVYTHLKLRIRPRVGRGSGPSMVGSQNFLSWLESGWSGPVSKISNAIYIQEIRRLSTLIPNDKKLYNIADFIIVYLFIKFWLLVAFLPCGDMWCSSC